VRQRRSRSVDLLGRDNPAQRMPAGKHYTAVVDLRRWHAGGLRLGESRTFHQCSAARGAPVSFCVLGQHGVAMCADAVHGSSLLNGTRNPHAAGLIRRTIPSDHSRMATQSRISWAGILPRGFPGMRRIRLNGNGKSCVFQRPPKMCRSAGCSQA